VAQIPSGPRPTSHQADSAVAGRLGSERRLIRPVRVLIDQPRDPSASPASFALTKYLFLSIISAMPVSSRDIEIMQCCYPQIYLACHLRHVRAASTHFRLSSRDSSLLAHLSETVPMAPSDLAAHLGVGPSTLSAAITKLQKLGYVERRPAPRDRRSVGLTLTRQGAAAMAETSVLDSSRVARVLERLSGPRRKQALAGLQVLAEASRQSMLEARLPGQRSKKRARGLTNA
jgi:DNA-binding MarR family transcriptional regulator